jgi:hypothetical protein
MRRIAELEHTKADTLRCQPPLLRQLRLLIPLLVLPAISGCATAPEATEEPAEPASVTPQEAPLPASDSAAGAPLPGADPGWLARAQQGIAEREYWASRNREGLQAPNRAHNLRTYFEPSGIRVHDRTAAGSPELVRLSLLGVGRGEDLSPVAPGELASEGSRVEIRRSGLVEWYANSPAGLEQGFTLAERPDGEGVLALELAVEHASASLRGERVILATPVGRRLAYGKLVVVDATGAPVAARLEVPEPGRVRLVVADAGAPYPLKIDPLLTETADTQIEPNQAGANLGWSVSGAGDVNGDGYADVIVGAYRCDQGETDEGVALIFHGSASGIDPGTPAAQLESDQAGANLGWGVAGAGDVNGDGYADVIVGARNYDRNYDEGQTDEGAAFVFLGSASGVATGGPGTAHAQLESDQADARLGTSVSGAGDVDGDGYADVIVGAFNYDAGQTDEGAAFVFLGSASGIADGGPGTAHAQLESDQAGARLGTSVSGAGDVDGDGYADVIVGVPDYDAGQTDEGAAFVFLGSASGIADGGPGTAHAQLESDQAWAYLGYSVSGAGDVDGDGYADVIVGAFNYDAGQTDEGAAFVYLGGAEGILDGDPGTAHAQLESDQAGANLGWGVAGAGDVNGDGYADVIVGARNYEDERGCGLRVPRQRLGDRGRRSGHGPRAARVGPGVGASGHQRFRGRGRKRRRLRRRDRGSRLLRRGRDRRGGRVRVSGQRLGHRGWQSQQRSCAARGRPDECVSGPKRFRGRGRRRRRLRGRDRRRLQLRRGPGLPRGCSVRLPGQCLGNCGRRSGHGPRAARVGPGVGVSGRQRLRGWGRERRRLRRRDRRRFLLRRGRGPRGGRVRLPGQRLGDPWLGSRYGPRAARVGPVQRPARH